VATVLVTGCNRGIGLEVCRQYRGRGDSVLGVCRQSNAELAALGIRVIDNIDVSNADDVAKLANTVGDEPLDILLNNAGIGGWDKLDTIDFDLMIQQYHINTLGPLRVTKALQKNLSDGSKVGIVSSRVGSMEDNGSGDNYGYRCSKAAVNMVGVNLHHDLSPKGIAVALLHPGYVATDMTGGGGISPVDSAAGLIARLDELNLENSGGFWHAEGYTLPW
jgi:NAD(P)-dependent dehydrogenase (short-subunit alcohol dehydrogenase family)